MGGQIPPKKIYKFAFWRRKLQTEMNVLEVCAQNPEFLRAADLCHFRLTCTTARKLLPKRLMNRNIACELSVGSLAQLKYAHEFLGFPLNWRVCVAAAANGEIECLSYAHEKGCPWDKSVCFEAAANGHLGCLIYAHKNGCPWDKWACEAAVRHGHVKCLEYLHKNGCPWDEFVCIIAAENNRPECLRYAHENGCPWDERVCIIAATNEHVECLQYAHRNGCSLDGLLCAEEASIPCLRYLRENGFTWWDEDTQGARPAFARI